MPGKKKGGGNRKKISNFVKIRRLEEISKDFNPATYEVYGKVVKPLGNRRFSVTVQKLKQPEELYGTINCAIKGSFRGGIMTNMYVLVKLYDFNTEQGQIIDNYTQDEIDALRAANMWDYPESSAVTESVHQTGLLDPVLLDSDSGSESESENDDNKTTVKGSVLDDELKNIDLI